MTNYAAIAALGPTHFWKLDETSGTAAADAGSVPVAGVYVGSPAQGQAAMTANGQSSGATVALDGTDDMVTVATNPPVAAFTVATWFTPTAVKANGVIFSWVFTGGHIPLCIAQDSAVTGAGGNANCIGAHVYNGSAWQRAQLSGAYVVGAPLFIVATVQSGVAVRLFVNGLMRASTPITAITNPAQPLRIGRRWDNPDYGQGRIAGVAMWDRVLTDTEVASMVPPLLGIYEPPEPMFPVVDPWMPWGEDLCPVGPSAPMIGELWPRGGRSW